MTFFGIYKTTNKVNGKMYIGKHHSEDAKKKMSEARKKYFE